ncbi:10 kDa heat shock protein [Beauveria asiatica]|uniref:10 kDa heat shock protein n=1 Tax=Beauveria asiatica TaxID=1069075 RepID=A0AAW0RSA3_9HYPO
MVRLDTSSAAGPSNGRNRELRIVAPDAIFTPRRAATGTKSSKKRNSLTEYKQRQATSIRSIRALAPLLDRVLVQRIKAETKTASGIFLPEASVEKLNEAKVIAVGPGALNKSGARLPMGVAVGDRVLIPQFGGSPVKAGEEEYQLFRDSEILAKINEQ